MPRCLVTTGLCLLGAAHSMVPFSTYDEREPPDVLRLVTFASAGTAIAILDEALHRVAVDPRIE